MSLGVPVRRILLAILCLLLLPIAARALNVCADPDYLPYSNRAGEGFENKIAEAVAKALGETVTYTWASHRAHGGFTQFLATTLDARKCDVVMSIPYGSREELTTRPYYISSYVFVSDKNKKYGITSLDAPILKRLKVGFEHDTPAEDSLKIRGIIPGTPPGSIVPFDITEEGNESPAVMLEALKTGRVDVLITWQPAIGAFLKNYPDLEVTQVPNSRALGGPEQFSFPMSMGVREKDTALQQRLDDVIQKHQSELSSILRASGVLLYESAQGAR
jgi:mxaJ protein